MSSKIYILKDCSQCPSRETDRVSYCCEKYPVKEITELVGFPEWCPLSDDNDDQEHHGECEHCGETHDLRLVCRAYMESMRML